MTSITDKRRIKKRVYAFGVLSVLFVALCFSLIFLLAEQKFPTGFVVSNVEVINTPPTAPELHLPENSSRIFEQNITYIWHNSFDDNYDALTYEFLLAQDYNFTSLVVNGTNISENPGLTNQSPNLTYLLSDYYWKAAAYDGEAFGNWSETWMFRYCKDNQAPNITAIGSFTLTELDYFFYQVSATDPDGDVLTYTDNTALFDINSTTGLIAFLTTTPGTFFITIVVSDGCNGTHDTFTLNILPRNLTQGTQGNGTGSGGKGGEQTPKPEKKPGQQQGGGASGGAAPAPPADQKKNESKEIKKGVEELTEEELARFRKAQIIYIGNFKYSHFFNVSMYEGPVWFFTYKETNYFLTLTNLSGESMYIGFFDGPGLLFWTPASSGVDLDNDGVTDIYITYQEGKSNRYSVLFEATVQPGIEWPSLILHSILQLRVLLIILLLALLMLLIIRHILADEAKRKDPLKITKIIIPKKDHYTIHLTFENIGVVLLENAVFTDPLPSNAELTGDIKITKKNNSETEITHAADAITLSVKEFPKKELLMVSYKLNCAKPPELTSVRASYQIRILETAVDFSKKYP